MHAREVEALADLDRLLAEERPLAGLVVKDLDLRRRSGSLARAQVRGAVFLGCRMSAAATVDLIARRALVFPALPSLPFDPWRRELYSADDLYGRGPLADAPDLAIYQWWRAHREGDVFAALVQRIHDHAIDDAVEELLATRDVVAIMGGHALRRGDPEYAAVAGLGRSLAREGFVVATGGGPGAMEAANLGASLAERRDGALTDALARLATVPAFAGPDGDPARWIRAGLAVRRSHPPGEATVTLGVPTWFYGHEPTNPFATHIAKYFANSIREDGLLAIANAGVIFTPGRAGTVQEVFQDATQNYYVDDVRRAAPMVLLGRRYWTDELPVAPLLRRLFAGRAAEDMIVSVDDPAEAVRVVADHAASRRIGRT